MESVLRGHPERTVPFCVKSWRMVDLSHASEVVHQETDNHLARREVLLPRPIRTDALGIQILDIHGDQHVYGGIFEVRVYQK